MRSSLGLQATDEIPSDALDKFRVAIDGVVKAFERLGVPRELSLSGPIKLAPRRPGDEANGRYDNKSDTVWIFYPQVNYVDTTFALAHEIAHRIWRNVSKTDQKLWTHAISALGKKIPPDAVARIVDIASNNGRNPLWFWYKLNVSQNLSGFRNYLKTLKYAPSCFPRQYSNSSPDEAWSDVVASMALGRSHLRNLTSKSGSFPLQLARKIIDRIATPKTEDEEPTKEKKTYGTTQIDLPDFGARIVDWVKSNVGRDWIDPIDGVATEPHITIFDGLLSDDVGPLRSLAKMFGGPITFSLGPLGFFDKADVDVLYASVDSEDLHKLHLMIGRLPSESGYPSYKPHMTIAYLKKGYAAQFRGQQPFVGTYQRNGFTLKRRDGNREFIPTVTSSELFIDQLNKNVLTSSPPTPGRIESMFVRSKLITVEDVFARSPLTILEQDPNEQPAPEEQPAQDDAQPQADQGQDQQQADTIINIQPVSETSEEFNSMLQKAVASVPDSLRQIVADEGYSIVSCAFLSDVVSPSQDGQVSIQWDQVSSAVVGDSKQIAIAESTKDQNGNPVPSLNVEGLFRHSFGHVLDSLAPKFVTEHYHDKLSDLEKFKYAHTSDTSRLNQEKQAKLAYYVAEGDVSRSECFAEVFAALHGGGGVYTIDVMNKYFPAVTKQIKDLLTSIEKGQKLVDRDQGDDQDQADQQPEQPQEQPEQPEQPEQGQEQ